MSQHDALILELQRWAYHQAMRYRPYPRSVAAVDEPAEPDEHPLARARQFAPGTRERAAKLLQGRDGRSRRMTVGAAIGMEIVPTWSSDPIRCKESRGGGGSGSSAVDHGIPPEYRWVDEALARLKRTAPVRAIVLRTEFTVNASQLTKARIAAEDYGGSLSKWQYRRELALGLAFMEGQRP